MASLPRNKPKTNPPQLKAHAQREARSGRLPQAIELLEELLRQTPDDWPTVQRLAELRARQGDRRAAVDLYRRLADHYEEDGHLARAIAVWRLILRHDPAFLGTHVKLGELYSLQGFRVESRRHYETALGGLTRAGRQREAELVRGALAAACGPPSVVPSAADPDEPASLDEAEFVAERLVEAKMFRRYQLFDQARQALEAVLHRVPNHDAARQEMVELLRDTGESERALKGQQNTPGEPPAPEPGADEERPDGVEPEFDLDLEIVEESVPDEAVVTARPEQVAPGPGGEPGPFVLQDVLDEVFAATPAAPASRPASPDAAGGAVDQVPAEDIVRVFREHVDAQLDRDDDEARYDLGIAYREMGLLDEAIAEFQLAARGDRRLVECASLLAGCFLEKGLPELAVQWLERGLAAPGRSDDEVNALRYELGNALEAAGQMARAQATFTELYGEAAGYRDVAARVEQLRAGGSQTGAARDVTRERKE